MTAPIRLRIPHQRRYHGIARLVVGGLAARLDVSYEQLEDIQLALASVLENDGYVVRADVTVELTVHDDNLSIFIGPLNGDQLRSDLAQETAEGISLGRLLGTVAESVELERRKDGEWLRLEKRIRSLSLGETR